MNSFGFKTERRDMEERNDMGKGDEVLLPGFRFHPTDEELVGFYLKRKVQQKTLAIELIRQLDIYKFDPWDLPSLAPTTGEKEWYFYCPRDQKYKNSSRPNRVTVAGFWKATGTDRPIYSSEGTKCIGLKKSLVFYRGRAARGTKTDWMMHEFRLPSFSSSIKMPHSDKNIHPNDSWAICRIFRKTTSMAQRELNQVIARPLPATKNFDIFPIPSTPLPDAKHLNCYPVLDFTSYNTSTHLNFSPAVLGDVKSASANIDFGQQETVDSSVNKEEAATRKSGSTLYVSNDQLVASEAIDFPFKFSWESSSCPIDASMDWPDNRCYSSLDDILQ